MNFIDFLIPGEILDLCELDKFDLLITIESTPANGQYPFLKIKINDNVIFNDQSQPTTIVQHQLITADPVQLSIEYYGRTDNETVLNNDGAILENQHLTITKVIINGVDIVANNIIYNFGNYRKNLSNSQKQYYLEHGIETEPTHSLSMYENGIWILNFEMPVLTQFVKIKSFVEKHENPWVKNINYKIYDTINIIRSLEKQIKNK